MGVASRLTAPVSQLKCYSRGNFSADTLLLLFRLFAESSLFRSMWPGHHDHVEILANKMVIYKKCSCLWCQLQIPSPMTKASFQATLNFFTAFFTKTSFRLCILTVTAGNGCLGDTDLIHVKTRAGGLDLALQMNFTFSWPTCQLLSIPWINTTGATVMHNTTDVKY